MKTEYVEESGEVLNIISGCIRNNPDAQKELYERYAGKLFGVCLSYSYDRADAEDTLHDGFLKIFKSIKQYKGEGTFESWMRRIMVNTALEKYRRSHKMVSIAETIKSTSENSIDNIISDISSSEILETVQGLSPQYRVVFLLYAVEGYSHKEISSMLNISEGTSKSNLSRARSILQEKIRILYEQRPSIRRIVNLSK